MGQAGCGKQKPLELSLLPLAAFSAQPLTLCFLPYSRISMPKGPWAAFVLGPTRLAEEKRQEDLGSMSVETLLPNGCLSSALGRDFQTNVSWVEAIYTEGKGLLCRRSAFPALGTPTDSVGSSPGHASRLASSSLGHASGKRGCSIALATSLWIHNVWFPHPLLRCVTT